MMRTWSYECTVLRKSPMKTTIALCLFGASLLQPAWSFADTAANNRAFTALADEYFDTVYFPTQPTVGTLSGYHEYDAKLED